MKQNKQRFYIYMSEEKKEWFDNQLKEFFYWNDEWNGNLNK